MHPAPHTGVIPGGHRSARGDGSVSHSPLICKTRPIGAEDVCSFDGEFPFIEFA